MPHQGIALPSFFINPVLETPSMIKQTLASITLGALTVVSSAALANDAAPANRVSHYQAQQAESIAQTMANLREANAKLRALLAGEVGEYDIHDIHSLSYTLEDSLARIAEEVKQLHNTVADMHFASEGLKRDAVIDFGTAYLEGIDKIVSP
ncbi:hypothetical protein B447_14319 [Thauera sp. 27]|nr:DUF6746 family protein [Thauera sp. 27]ENO78500.1 hypothetical protein B447_14319 [Thauera sp. 27]